MGLRLDYTSEISTDVDIHVTHWDLAALVAGIVAGLATLVAMWS